MHIMNVPSELYHITYKVDHLVIKKQVFKLVLVYIVESNAIHYIISYA